MTGFTYLQRLAFLLLLVFAVSPSAWPQSSTATVSGTVRDQTGAVIPGANVTLTRQDTNESSKTASSSMGYYVFAGLVPGPYLLVVEAAGMQKFEGTLTVLVQQSAVVDVTMHVGQTSAEVSVQEVTPLLTVDNPTLGGTLEHTQSSSCRSMAAQ